MAIDIATARTEIAKLYIAAFNRVPDSAGLSFWVDSYVNHGRTLDQIAQNFTESTEYATKYPAYQTNAEYVEAIYVNVFGRASDTEGKAYWEARLISTGADALTHGTLMNAMVAAAASNGSTDGTKLANQATYAVNSVIAGINTDAATAQLSTVTADTATITTATTAATTAAAAAAGTTYTLTTAADSMTGTSSNDTFNGTYDGAATGTLNVSDTINGGSGTDTLNIIASDDAVVTLPAAQTTSIETVNVRNVDGDATAQVLTVSAANFVGVTSLNSDRSTDSVTFTNIADTTAVGIIGNGTITNGATVATHAATATSAELNISGGTVGTGAVTINGAALTSAVINSTGAANTIGALTGAATTTSTTVNATTALTTGALTNAGATLTITGAGAVSFGATALEAGVTTINASANTGGVTAALGTAVTQAVTGSAGNDVFTTGAVLTTGNVNGGDGTDTLVVTAGGTHLATAALGAKYTNFETIRLNDSQDMSVISGITAVELNALTNKSVTNMSATQAANVKVLGDQTTGVTLALASATGTSDVLSITTGTGLTNTAAFDLNALTVTGFETLNINANAGATATTANKTVVIASLTGATLNTVNLTGTAFSITNAATTVAATINASALTGDDATTELGLTIGSTTFASGSTVTGSSYVDNVTIAAGTEGVTLNLGAGNDLVTADVASLVADGTTDGAINGGTGTDQLTVSDAGATTMTDNHFTKLSAMEKLVLTNTAGDASITTGSAFNAAFADGATITTGVKATATAATLNAGLATVAVNYTLDATDMVGATGGKDVTVTTGTGADTVTITGDATWVGAAGDGSSIIISTGAGADTISVTIGTLLAQTTSQAITITGGTGVDTITKVGTNCTTTAASAHFVMAEGDSTTTAFDKITGLDVADGTNVADVLDFAGVGAVGTLATSTDYNTITSHSISNGVALFDDAAVYATALIINSANLADVVGYLHANTAALDTVAFAYDSDNNGANDCTLVFNHGVTTDSLVQLTGTTGVVGLTATLTTTTANYIAIA